jgi:hypothetical protein
MAKRNYEKCVIPIESRIYRPGEQPSVSFKAQPYGIDASWGIIVATQAPDEETRKRLNENPHKHPHHQFITYFGSNPYNIAEFDAEISIFWAKFRRIYHTKPTVIHFLPGVVHGYGQFTISNRSPDLSLATRIPRINRLNRYSAGCTEQALYYLPKNIVSPFCSEMENRLSILRASAGVDYLAE